MKTGKLSTVEWQGRFAHQKSIIFKEDDLKSPGSKFQVIKISPGGEIKAHYHKVRTEIFYVLQGRGTVSVGGSDFQCEPHDFFLCEAGEIHAFGNLNGTEDFVLSVYRTNDPGDTDMLWVDGEQH